MATDLQTIVLGGGCFWCVEAVFDQVEGVTDVESGYCNGHVMRPTYEQVCSGTTGHTEVIKVEFDASVVSLAELLDIFFTIHDPTTLNRQGADAGTQYRSGIYTVNDAQVSVARSVIAEQQVAWKSPIVTEVLPLANYSTAEAYHQNYFEQHPNQGYCAMVAAPKVLKFRSKYANRVKAAYL